MLLDEAGHPLPDAVRSAEDLTVWAVQFRYEHILDARLDRGATVELVAAVREWATAAMGT
jgi:hypothetical protein